MARYLNPTSDLVFKRIFGEHQRLLKSFLNAILPLEIDQHITSLEYLSPEQAPAIPEFKRPIVDVKCTDQQGRVFIVEMQIEWVTEFKERMLFNASTAYVKQLPRGGNYTLLRPVYGVALLANNFDKDSPEWYHHFKMVNMANNHKVIEGLQLVFIELKKFKAQRTAANTLKELWLRFMSEVDEHTIEVADDILAVAEIKEAATLSEESAYTRAELEYYDKYWDSISTEKTLISGKYAEGKAEGKTEEQILIAQRMLLKNYSIEVIAEVTNLDTSLINKLYDTQKNSS